MHVLYLQLVICSSDTKHSVKTLYFCSREVLRGQITLSIIDRKYFSYQSITRSKMLEKYCDAVSFEKEQFLTNNSIPISLKVHNYDISFCII